MNKQKHNISFMEGFENYEQIQFQTMKRQTDIRWIKSSLRMLSKQPISKDILNVLISFENCIFLYVCVFQEIDLQAMIDEK